MLDTILLKLRLKLRGPPPVDVLTAVIRQHLLGNAVLRRRLAVELQYIIGRLRHTKAQSHDITGIVVDKSDEVNLTAAHAKHHDVALPHLVGRAALESTGLLNIAVTRAGRSARKTGLRKRRAYRTAAGRQQKPPPQRGHYPPDAESRVLPLDRHDLFGYRGMHP
jgi:hypothetical protein